MSRKAQNHYLQRVNITGQSFSGMRKVSKERIIRGQNKKTLSPSATLRATSSMSVMIRT